MDLMAHRGHELGPGALRRLHVLSGALQFQRQPLLPGQRVPDLDRACYFARLPAQWRASDLYLGAAPAIAGSHILAGFTGLEGTRPALECAGRIKAVESAVTVNWLARPFGHAVFVARGLVHHLHAVVCTNNGYRFVNSVKNRFDVLPRLIETRQKLPPLSGIQ